MIQFFRTLPYHFKSALKSVKRNIAMTISSATAVTVTLFLILLFIVIAVNINSISQKVEQSVEIFAQIDKVVEETEYDSIQKQLESIEHVKNVRFSSKEEQMEKFLESDLGGEEYRSVFEDGNPLTPAYFVEVDSGSNIKQVAKDAGKVEGILKAEYGGESATTMLDAFNSIRVGGAIFVVALCFLAIFLISNTIKMTIQARRDEIAIMRNVGASNGFIKTPFIIEGIIISILGSVIPITLGVFGYYFAYDAMNGMMFSSLFTLQAPMPFVIYLSLAILGIGILVGMIGSFVSVGKYLKWKR